MKHVIFKGMDGMEVLENPADSRFEPQSNILRGGLCRAWGIGFRVLGLNSLKGKGGYIGNYIGERYRMLSGLSRGKPGV